MTSVLTLTPVTASSHFKVIYSLRFESLYTFKYQLNALTLCDTIVALLRNVSA